MSRTQVLSVSSEKVSLSVQCLCQGFLQGWWGGGFLGEAAVLAGGALVLGFLSMAPCSEGGSAPLEEVPPLERRSLRALRVTGVGEAGSETRVLARWRTTSLPSSRSWTSTIASLWTGTDQYPLAQAASR